MFVKTKHLQKIYFRKNFKQKKMENFKQKMSRVGDTEIWVTATHAYRVCIEGDEFCESPREWDNLGTFVTWQSKRVSPDANSFESHKEFFAQIDAKTHVVLPVYCCEHSGISYNTTGFNCSWDSGQVGFIYCSKADAIECFGVKNFTQKVKERAIHCLTSEVEIYSAWANGQCYSYIIGDCPLKSILPPYLSVTEFCNLSEIDRLKIWESVGEIDFQIYESCGGFIELDHELEKMECYKQAIENF